VAGGYEFVLVCEFSGAGCGGVSEYALFQEQRVAILRDGHVSEGILCQLKCEFVGVVLGDVGGVGGVDLFAFLKFSIGFVSFFVLCSEFVKSTALVRLVAWEQTLHLVDSGAHTLLVGFLEIFGGSARLWEFEISVCGFGDISLVIEDVMVVVTAK